MPHKLFNGINYLIYGINEHRCRNRIVELIDGNISNALFFPWTPQDGDISRLFSFSNSKLDIDNFISSNVSSPWLIPDSGLKSKGTKSSNEITFQGFLSSKNKSRFVILDSIHLLSHASSDPFKFYKELLGACNYHSHVNNIHFMVSCVRIPIVFHKENPLRHMWEFIDCNPLVGEIDSEFNNSLKFFTGSHNLLSAEVYERIKERIRAKFDREISNLSRPDEITSIDPTVRDAIDGVTESLSLYRSDLYLPDSHIPVLDEAAENKIYQLSDAIVGQEEACQKLIEKVLISRKPADAEAAAKEKKPRGIFLFVGPSGVGKTRICQELAECLPDYRFLQINLGEHQDRDSVNKLIGVGKGYVDSDLGGILTEPVRLHSKYVLLFDELDQAHNSVGQLFYKIFEGEVTDGRGRQVSFSDCYIVMTTNKGAIEGISEPQSQQESFRREEVEKKLVDETKENKEFQLKFTPALLGRINDIIHFHPLSISDLTEVAKGYFYSKIRDPYEKIGIKFKFTVTGLAAECDTHLIDMKILDCETMLFEMFAIAAGHENDQGARRLFQLMDEHLITPLELARIGCPKCPELSEIECIFAPVLADETSFEKPSIVIIDDKSSEVETLKNTLNDVVNVTVCGFDLNGADIENALVVLLDLYDGTSRIDVQKYLGTIRARNPVAPVILHSSLEESPLRGILRNAHWKTGTFGYLIKDESAQEDAKKLVSKAIQAYHARSKTGITIKRLSVTPPDSFKNTPLQFVYTYEQQ